MNADIQALHERVQQESAWVDQVLAETGKVIVGQRTMVERVLMGILTGGHILLEGVPGLAKTLTVNTIARRTCCPRTW
jgi:MoxR-like ATPase